MRVAEKRNIRVTANLILASYIKVDSDLYHFTVTAASASAYYYVNVKCFILTPSSESCQHIAGAHHTARVIVWGQTL